MSDRNSKSVGSESCSCAIFTRQQVSNICVVTLSDKNDLTRIQEKEGKEEEEAREGGCSGKCCQAR